MEMEKPKPKPRLKLYVTRPFLTYLSLSKRALLEQYTKSKIVFLVSLGSKRRLNLERSNYSVSFTRYTYRTGALKNPRRYFTLTDLRELCHYFISLAKIGLQRLNLFRLFVCQSNVKDGYGAATKVHIYFDKSQFMVTVSSKNNTYQDVNGLCFIE